MPSYRHTPESPPIQEWTAADEPEEPVFSSSGAQFPIHCT